MNINYDFWINIFNNIFKIWLVANVKQLCPVSSHLDNRIHNWFHLATFQHLFYVAYLKTIQLSKLLHLHDCKYRDDLIDLSASDLFICFLPAALNIRNYLFFLREIHPFKLFHYLVWLDRKFTLSFFTSFQW